MPLERPLDRMRSVADSSISIVRTASYVLLQIYTTYLNSLSSLAAYEATGKVPSTGFIHLTGLSEIEQKFGTESEETEKAKEMLRLTVDVCRLVR